MENSKIKKLKIAVLYGGPSSEREISIKSGTAVINALNNLKIKNFPIIVNNDQKWLEEIKKTKPDFVFIALHGKFGEDGTVQSILDSLNIPYSGSDARSSNISMDKQKTKEILMANKILTPAWTVITADSLKRKDNLRSSLFPLSAFRFSLPYVVKPVSEGSAVGVSIVEKKNELIPAIKKVLKYDSRILVEKYIRGMEITVAILGNEALTPIEIIPKGKFYDYKSKYQIGMSEHIIPARLPKNILEKAKKIALKTFITLGCKAFSRIDMIVDKNNDIFVLENNTIPGMTVTSLFPEAARENGYTFEKMIIQMIKHSLC